MNRDSVNLTLKKLGDAAISQSGLYYELYLAKFNRAVREHIDTLSDNDALDFIREVKGLSTEITFDDEEYKYILESEAECWRDIRKEQE